MVETQTNAMLYEFINCIDTSLKTKETYTRALEQFVKWLDINEIANPVRADIIHYREEIKARLKPNTVQIYIIAIRQFYKWLEQEGYYKNIAENIKGARISREHKKDAFTVIQIKDVLNTLGSCDASHVSYVNDTQYSLNAFNALDTCNTTDIYRLRDYAILLLAVTGGVRTIELQRANICDMRNLRDHTVLYLQGKGKDEKTDYVKLTPPVEKAIRSYINKRITAKQTDPLFASHSDRNCGHRLTTRSISRLMKNAFIKSGYISDRLTAHSLRHTAGTINLLCGGTLEETQQLLRHKDINTTMIYLHHIERDKNKSEQRITDAIF